ncbi:MAG: hypothetical protein JOZ72_16740 [Alphaproteobacteria bacterium]|nr:hypothetical protein [Alphaproteobacteria bacterium]
MPASRLLVVRAGDRSLHPAWLDGPRDWDLHISYFGDRAQPFVLGKGVSLSREKGPKWLGLKECLGKHPEFLERYGHIGFPDDDLACNAATWNTAFQVLAEIGADLGQPALDPRSFFSYDITLKRRGLKYRETDFVELMCPIFRVAFLSEVLPTWTLNKSSWGLDMVWRELARRAGRKLAIIDAAAVLHTRAIGKGTQYSAANMQGATPDEEYRALLGAYGITDTSRHSLRGETLDGRTVTRGLNRHLRLAGLRRNWRAWRGTAQIE